MKSNKVLLLTIILLSTFVAPSVFAKNYDSLGRGSHAEENHMFYSYGRGTIQNNDGSIINSRMLLVGRLDQKPNIDGDFEGTATIIMKNNLPDGTKISAFRDLDLIVDMKEGIYQGFKVKIQGKYVEVPAIFDKKKAYGHLSTSIIAHEATHIVDYYLRCKIVLSKDWDTGSY